MNFTRICCLLMIAGLVGCEHLDNIRSAINKKLAAEKVMQQTKQYARKKRDGLVVSRRKDGSLLSEINLKNSKKHGWARDYYPNGNLHAEFNYIDGVLHGERKWYHESGEIYKITPFAEGKIEGIEKMFHKNGRLVAEIPYKANYPGIGLREYTQEGAVSKKRPSLVIEAADHIARSNDYILKIRLSDHSKQVQFYVGELTDGKYMNDQLTRIVTNNGVGTLKYKVMPGYAFIEKLNIVARQTTAKGNPYIVQQGFNLSVENKGNQ